MADSPQGLEGKLQDQVNRAVKARALREDPLFIEAAEAIKDDIWRKFLSCDPKDTATLQLIRVKAEAFNDFLAQFRKHLETGRFASHELERIKANKQRKTEKRPTRFRRHRL